MIKKASILILSLIAPAAMIYLLGCFVNWNMDASKWTSMDRGLAAFLYFVIGGLSLAAAIAYLHTENPNPHFESTINDDYED
jgi:hypothetical protein